MDSDEYFFKVGRRNFRRKKELIRNQIGSRDAQKPQPYDSASDILNKKKRANINQT